MLVKPEALTPDALTPRTDRHAGHPEGAQGHHHHGHEQNNHGHHDHGHHAHAHDHDHPHDHHHEQAVARPNRRRYRSLMALSGGQRLVLVLPLIATLWLLAYWALKGTP